MGAHKTNVIFEGPDLDNMQQKNAIKPSEWQLL